MTYKETLEWMFAQLPMYQKIGGAAYKKDLQATLDMMKYLNHPEVGFKSILVAGTNGKGSVSHMLASIFQEAGYKTGLYTSPHLRDFRERIKINGKMIPESEVTNFINAHASFLKSEKLSFFEMTVGLAFEYFRKEKVAVAIIETGMGGRLDSTNVIRPEVSVITNIGLDHTQFLGNSPAEIAAEKAGIIKYKIPVVIGEENEETLPVFIKTANAQEAPLILAEKDETYKINEITLDLKGDYQQKNLKTVLSTIKILQDLNWKLPEVAVVNGLSHVVRNTGLLGRWQQLQDCPKVICDTGHNKEGLKWVVNQLRKEKYDKLHIVLGVVSDKDLNQILPLFPKDAIYYFCKPDIPRGMSAELLKDAARPFALEGKAYATVQEAYQNALKKAAPEDLVFVGGSTFVVAEVI
ncbi:MAG: bifunctional folylpolyglutamate synthase/dihydrofolate synthase [Bacteroidetes bacterium]|nr:bifunctional folylpolyglutamate synthase/dihydrofolate synthase [Bacteroidota bacterium]